MKTTVRPESADQAEVRALIDALDAYQKPLYPPESHHGIDLAALSRPEVVFVVARDDSGRAVGCGALVVGTAQAAQTAGGVECQGELKRMYLDPAWRGLGHAAALLQCLEQQGAARGRTVLRLETGIHQHAALAFYARAGYRERPPFAPYRPDPLSVFMEKLL